MKSYVFAVLCLTGASAMRLMKDKDADGKKDGIKPVQDKSLMGLNLAGVKAKAHKTLSELRTATEHTKIKPLFDAAEQGLNFVEYKTKQDAKAVSDAVKYHMENE